MDIVDKLTPYIGSAKCARYDVLREAVTEINRLREEVGSLKATVSYMDKYLLAPTDQ